MPPDASSNAPTRRDTAPVNEPFSWPNSSLSSRFGGIAPQSTTTNGPSRRASRRDGSPPPRRPCRCRSRPRAAPSRPTARRARAARRPCASPPTCRPACRSVLPADTGRRFDSAENSKRSPTRPSLTQRARAQESVGDAHAVDDGAVAAVEIAHVRAVVGDAHFAVEARHRGVLDDEVVRRVEADRAAVRRRLPGQPRLRALRPPSGESGAPRRAGAWLVPSSESVCCGSLTCAAFACIIPRGNATSRDHEGRPARGPAGARIARSRGRLPGRSAFASKRPASTSPTSWRGSASIPTRPRSRASSATRSQASSTRSAPDVAGFAVGDRVFGMTKFGGYSDTVVMPAAQAFRMPDKMSFEEAAALPVVYLTAHHMLLYTGSLRPGMKVLIHSAAGGVGLAAVDLLRGQRLRDHRHRLAGQARLPARARRAALPSTRPATSSAAVRASSAATARSTSCATPSAAATWKANYNLIASRRAPRLLRRLVDRAGRAAQLVVALQVRLRHQVVERRSRS